MKLYTIGHGTVNVSDFIATIRKYDINAIVDVRSIPYSKYVNAYNRENIEYTLKENKISYIYMGDLLGARYNNSVFFNEDRRVIFKKVQKTANFNKGIERIINGINKGFTISLMCSEEDAFVCHRFGLISVYIRDKVNIIHIGTSYERINAELEQRLISTYDSEIDQIRFYTENPLNLTMHDYKLNEAYKFHNLKIGYVSGEN